MRTCWGILTSNNVCFEYEEIKGEPHETIVKNINPYLIEGKDIWVSKIRHPICNVPEMNYGSMANDGGNLLIVIFRIILLCLTLFMWTIGSSELLVFEREKQ